MKVKNGLLILLSSFVAIGMCSCSGPKPSEVAKTFLEGIKKQDEKVVTDVYALGKLDILGASYKKDTSKNEEGDKEDKDPKMDKLFNEQLLPKCWILSMKSAMKKSMATRPRLT